MNVFVGVMFGDGDDVDFRVVRLLIVCILCDISWIFGVGMVFLVVWFFCVFSCGGS